MASAHASQSRAHSLLGGSRGRNDPHVSRRVASHMSFSPSPCKPASFSHSLTSPRLQCSSPQTPRTARSCPSPRTLRLKCSSTWTGPRSTLLPPRPLLSAPLCGGRGGRRRPSPGVVASLGFTSDPRISVERLTSQLLKDAASLFCLQGSLRTPEAQAFLRLLLLLSRSDDQLRVLEAYGDFYRRMTSSSATSAHATWQDCLLEAILTVEDCPFAAASAAAPARDTPLPPHLTSAAAFDLSALQRMAVAESTLVGWVCNSASDQPPEWRAAAECARPPVSGASAWGPGSGAGAPSTGASAAEDGTANGSAAGGGSSLAPGVPSVSGSAGVGAAEQEWQARHVRPWREELGGAWAWGQATQMLQRFYWEHGFGAASLHRLLGWSEKEQRLAPLGSTSPLSPLLPTPSHGHGHGHGQGQGQGPVSSCIQHPHYALECQTKAQDVLVSALAAHAGSGFVQRSSSGERAPGLAPGAPPHVLLFGPPGMGKTHILQQAILQSLARAGTGEPAAAATPLPNEADPRRSPGHDDVSAGNDSDVSREEERGQQSARAAMPFLATRLRFVEVRKETLKWLPQLLQYCSGMRQLRFVLFMDDVSFKAGEEGVARLAPFLGESLSWQWPRNVLLVATSESRDLMKPRAPASTGSGSTTALSGSVAPASAGSGSTTAAAAAGAATAPSASRGAALGGILPERLDADNLGALFPTAVGLHPLSGEGYLSCLQEVARQVALDDGIGGDLGTHPSFFQPPQGGTVAEAARDARCWVHSIRQA